MRDVRVLKFGILCRDLKARVEPNVGATPKKALELWAMRVRENGLANRLHRLAFWLASIKRLVATR